MTRPHIPYAVTDPEMNIAFICITQESRCRKWSFVRSGTPQLSKREPRVGYRNHRGLNAFKIVMI